MRSTNCAIFAICAQYAQTPSSGFHPEKTSLYHSLLDEISYSTL